MGKRDEKLLKIFLDKARAVHGDRYDYSMVRYVNNRTPITICCKVHGKFTQIPFVHYEQKSGCPKCHPKTYPLNFNSFVARARLVHCNKYNYAQANYINNYTKVDIICPVHGVFKQRPWSHLEGQGCRRCIKNKPVSRREIEFLNHVGISPENRQCGIPTTNFLVDGVDKAANVIYEFLGDYWHGNPRVFPRNTKMRGGHLTCGDVFDRTMQRFASLSMLGYTIKYVWESDWVAWKKSPTTELPINTFIRDI